MTHRKPADDILDQGVLIGRAAHMLQSGRGAVEQAFHGDLRARIAGPGRHGNRLAVLDLHPGRLIAVRRAQCHFGHRSDGRQRLPAETEGSDPPEIFLAVYLRGCVPLKSHDRVFAVHAAAVVGHRNPAQAALFDIDLDPRAARVNRIFH